MHDMAFAALSAARQRLSNIHGRLYLFDSIGRKSDKPMDVSDELAQIDAALAALAAEPAPVGEYFQTDLHRAIEAHLVHLVRTGSAFKTGYNAGLDVGSMWIKRVYDAMDKDRLLAQIVERAEKHLADKMFDQVATEMTTDAKKILSNGELRETVRATLRVKMHTMIPGEPRHEDQSHR